MEEEDTTMGSKRRRAHIHTMSNTDQTPATPDTDSNQGAFLFEMGSR